MVLLSLFLIAFVSYFIWKPLLTLDTTYTPPTSSSSIFESFQTTTQKRAPRQDARPKQGFQGGEYIDFEEL